MKKISDITIKKNIIYILVALLMTVPLCACGKKSDYEVSPVKHRGGSQNITTEGGSTEVGSTDAVTTEAVSTTEDVGHAGLSDSNLISDDTDLYDLSSLIRHNDGLHIADIAALDDENLLILYKEGTEEGETPLFSIERINIISGEKTTLVDKKPLEFSGAALPFLNVIFASVDPLVIYDSCDNRFYDIAGNFSKRVEMPDSVGIDKPFVCNGQLYITASSGSIYSLNSSFDTTEIWNAPENFNNFHLFKQNGSEITLETYLFNDGNVDQVYLAIDTVTGELKETYTLNESLLYPLAISDSSSITQSCEDDGRTTLNILLSDNTQYSLYPSGEGLYATGLRNGTIEPKMGYFSASDKGLFFHLYNSKTEENLLYWQFKESEKSYIAESPHTPYITADSDHQELDDYIKSIEAKYNIKVIIDEKDFPYTTGYEITADTDTNRLYTMLAFIDKCYSNYPPDLLEQLGNNGIPMRIIPVYSIYGVSGNSVSAAAGLTYYDYDGYYIYFATQYGTSDGSLIYHETMHVIYYKLLMDGFLTENADDFMNLNPPGFQYSSAYNNSEWPDSSYTSENYDHAQDYSDVYFIRPYSKIYETEDASDLMGYLMGYDTVPDYYRSIHLQQKCQYFFNLIRQGFVTDGWPEKLAWEQRLDDFINSH